MSSPEPFISDIKKRNKILLMSIAGVIYLNHNVSTTITAVFS